jgi:hypothetical protein
MILNPFPCENCGQLLQPENIILDVDEAGNLIRICEFCKHMEKLKE